MWVLQATVKICDQRMIEILLFSETCPETSWTMFHLKHSPPTRNWLRCKKYISTIIYDTSHAFKCPSLQDSLWQQSLNNWVFNSDRSLWSKHDVSLDLHQSTLSRRYENYCILLQALASICSTLAFAKILSKLIILML